MPTQRTGNGGISIYILRKWIVCLACAAFLASSGCRQLTLTITQDKYINTAVWGHRPPDERRGDPLEVAIVCVYPEDLEDEANQLLRPGSSINCEQWYKQRPEGDEEKNKFNLDTDQIYLLTNDKSPYGTRLGPALRGAEIDRRKEIPIKTLEFKRKLNNRDSVIYVFAKFTGRDGKVLPVRPAIFNPPGSYAPKLSVMIGVRELGVENEQYIENTKMRRSERRGRP